MSPPIYFYLPPPHFPQPCPPNARENWPGFGLGIHAWTLQTYLRLQEDGFPCELTQSLPPEGIVLFHHNTLRILPRPPKPGPKRLFICIKADGRRYPHAQLHLVQNPASANPRLGCYYLPHWPQPGLIPRSPERGERLENLTYFGHASNLAPELQSAAWSSKLSALGLRWQPIINSNRWNSFQTLDSGWNDYSQIDAIVAVRRFRRRAAYGDKPGTKLYNAWLAGVPALLGAESAYRLEGKHQVNYLEVTSLEELITALQQLRADPSLRNTLVKNGQIAAQEFHPEKLKQKWRNFLLEIAVPAFYDWLKLPSYRQRLMLGKNFWLFLGEKVQYKLLSP